MFIRASVLNMYVCVKFGCKSATVMGILAKQHRGGSFLLDTLYSC